jgi:hypothetical protein
MRNEDGFWILGLSSGPLSLVGNRCLGLVCKLGDLDWVEEDGFWITWRNEVWVESGKLESCGDVLDNIRNREVGLGTGK